MIFKLNSNFFYYSTSPLKRRSRYYKIVFYTPEMFYRRYKVTQNNVKLQQNIENGFMKEKEEDHVKIFVPKTY